MPSIWFPLTEFLILGICRLIQIGQIFSDTETGRLGLIDFGATREYRPFFVNNYFKILQGAANGDRNQILDFSTKVGFLTGYENKEMNDAHVDSVMILAEPFRKNHNYNYAAQKATSRMQELVPIMLKNGLCPPPPEVYSLHRKMSGLFLMAAKLKADINCYEIWQKIECEFNNLCSVEIHEWKK